MPTLQWNRWVLLEHKGDPNDPKGLHFDLLLEDGKVCRAWRLSHIPVLDGPSITATKGPSHKLAWLEKQESTVSGGRGTAKRVLAGVFKGSLQFLEKDPVKIFLLEGELRGVLKIQNRSCTLRSKG